MSLNENWDKKYDLNSIVELSDNDFDVAILRLVAELERRHQAFQCFDRGDLLPECLTRENDHEGHATGLISMVFPRAFDGLVAADRPTVDFGHADEREFLEIFNGLYGGRHCTKILSVVWGCEFGKEMHIGHILPRSRPELFGSLFPSLDVDNILNLAPQGYLSNCVCGNAALPFIFTVHRCYLEVYKRILNVRHKLEALLLAEDVVNAHRVDEAYYQYAADLIEVPQRESHRIFEEKVIESINDARPSIPHETARQMFADKKAKIRDEMGLK